MVCAMSQTAAAALDEAIGDCDGTRARRRLQDLVGDVGTDAALEHVARQAAAESMLAVELLVEHLDDTGLVRRFVGGVLLDETAIDEVSQDTLVSVATAIASFKGDAKFTTWLHRVARNRSVDYLRRQRATSPLGDEQDVGEAVRMSSMIATRETVRQLLMQLPDHYRQAVTLRDVEGLSYEGVAARLDRNVNTVKSHVARGRAMVAALVHESGADL